MDAVRQRLERVPPWVLDALLAIAVAVATTIAIRVEPGLQGRDPDVFAYAFGWVVGALLLLRRRWPLGVLVASFVVLQAYQLSDY